jgi:LCP family protein required for cell wall assembly
MRSCRPAGTEDRQDGVQMRRHRSRRRDRGHADRHGVWRRKSRLAKTGYVIASVFALLVVVGGVGGYAEYRHLEGNITVLKVGGLSGRTVYGAQNILVLGSQVRAGQHGHFGVAAGSSPLTANSDNLLVVHLDPTHTHALILSIPRDTFVYEPGCPARNSFIGYGIQGPYNYPPGNIIDGALNIGGPTCAVHTVEDLTGIKLDHFVEFNFNSFRAMVDTLGGVWVCVPPGRGYHDQASGVNLNPGRHLLKYDQALAYVRTRHALGGADAGGDLPRIELQQAFISSAMQQVNSKGLLSNIPSLLSIANTATKALTVDKGLGSVPALLHLARSLVHLKTRNVNLITMPTTTDTYNYPAYSQHLMAVQPQDDVLFGMVINGQNWHGSLPTVPHSSVQVHVLNATGQGGLAARTAAKLRKLGFDVLSVGDTGYSASTTVTYSGIAQADSAYTLMLALSKFPAGQNLLAEPAPQLGSPGPVTLVLGADFAGVKAPALRPANGKSGTGKPKSGKTKSGPGAGSVLSAAGQNGPSAVQARNAASSICSGLPPAG